MERLTGTLDLLHRAYAAGLTVRREGTTLHIAGPRSAVAIVRELQAAKPAVMALVDYLAGDAAALDWRASVLALQERPCVLCDHGTRLISPYGDHRLTRPVSRPASTTSAPLRRPPPGGPHVHRCVIPLTHRRPGCDVCGRPVCEGDCPVDIEGLGREFRPGEPAPCRCGANHQDRMTTTTDLPAAASGMVTAVTVPTVHGGELRLTCWADDTGRPTLWLHQYDGADDESLTPAAPHFDFYAGAALTPEGAARLGDGPPGGSRT